MTDKHKILIVDDETRNVEILELLLEEHFEIETVGTGEAALEVVPRFMPDIILLDIMMPGINGYEVCQKIKENPKLQFIKIILVSGKALTEDRLKGYEYGADDYLVKPFDTDELLAKVRVFIKLKNAEEIDSIKSDFISLISHETNTPLNGIIGLSELLLEADHFSEEDRESIQMIHDSGYRLHEFIDKARLLCELKTDVKTTKSVEQYLGIVTNATHKADYKYKKGTIFDINIDADLNFMADWRLVSKAVVMLIDNAVKFSDNGTTVEVYTTEEHEMCNLVIVDYGCGLPESSISSIFNEFSVEDISHHSSGLGLSLATVKEIAHIHGGSIKMTSEHGVKTTLTFSIPIEKL